MQSDAPTARPVLVVSEDVTWRESLYDLLAKHRIPVITAHSEERALAILKHEYPGLILVDTRSPEADASSFIHAVRCFDYTLPILMVGQPMRVSAQGAKQIMQATCDGTVSNEVILAEVTKWLAVREPSPDTTCTGTILLVDDEPKIRHVMSDFLRQRGFDVLTAHSGERAIQKLSTATPHLVLLDIKLPGMDGLLTLKKIKTMRPGVAVVMLTGLEDEALMAQAYALGALEYMTKPVDLAYLDSLLKNTLIFNSP